MNATEKQQPFAFDENAELVDKMFAYDKISIRRHRLTNAELRSLNALGVESLEDLSKLMIRMPPGDLRRADGFSDGMIAFVVLYAQAVAINVPANYTEWYENYRFNTAEGKIWYRRNHLRFDWIKKGKQPGGKQTKEDRGIPVDSESARAEEFMEAFYASGLPYDSVKAAISVGLFSQNWANLNPVQAQRRASDHLRSSRDYLDRQGLLEQVQVRGGIDVEGARDMVKKRALDGLHATQVVFKKDPTDPKKYIQVEETDWRTVGYFVKLFKDTFGITKDEILRSNGGAPTVPKDRDEAIADLVDTIVRNCRASKIEVEDLFYAVRDKLKRVY